MIYQLPKSKYETVKKIFKDWEYNVRVTSVIEKNTKGNIWVDNVKNPSTVLVWSYFDMFTLGGCETNEEFNSELEDFIIKKINPQAQAVNLNFFAVQLYPREPWEDMITDLFKRPLAINYEYQFEFNYEKYKKSSKLLRHGFSLFNVNHLLNSNERLKNKIEETWVSLDKFAEKGFGYCIVHRDEIISTCTSRHVGGNQHNISIITKKEYRGKGFATAAAKAFISHCLAHQGTPVWKADESNTASLRLAKTLGFEKRDKYPDYYFSWREG